MVLEQVIKTKINKKFDNMKKTILFSFLADYD